MVLAVLIARFLGWDNGLSVVALVTIVITRIIDIDLPVRKVAPLTFVGFIMAVLAFTSVSLGSSSFYINHSYLGIFLYFSVYLREINWIFWLHNIRHLLHCGDSG